MTQELTVGDLCNVDEIISRLPDGLSVNIWTTYDRRVCMQLCASDGKRESFAAERFSDAIRMLMDGSVIKKLSVRRIQRRPGQFLADDHEAMRSGDGWIIVNKQSRRDCNVHLKTRKAAIATMEKWEQMSAESIAKYDAAFSEMFPNGAVEGVDYRYD